MTNHPKFDMTGIRRMDIGILNDDGIPMGLTGSLANGADSGLYRVEGLKNADMSMGNPDVVSIVGDGRFQSAYVFPPGEAPQGTIEGTIYDVDLAVALEGTKKVTKGPFTWHVAGGREADYVDCMAILQGWAKSKTTGYRGKKLYWGYIVPKLQIAVLGTTAMQQRQAVDARLQMVISESDIYPWGEALALASEGVTGGLVIPFSGQYPMVMHTFVGDGTTDDVVLEETPAGDDDASPQMVFVYDWTNEAWLVTTTAFTVDAATKTLTYEAASIPAAGEVNVIVYAYVP